MKKRLIILSITFLLILGMSSTLVSGHPGGATPPPTIPPDTLRFSISFDNLICLVQPDVMYYSPDSNDN